MADLKADEISDLAVRWYKALDVHVPIDQLWPMLAGDDLEMTFPEGVMRGHEGFAQWYQAVTNRFFDEVHTVKEVSSTIDGERADVKVVVNWQAKIWDPPAANSAWLGFDAYQTWVVSRDANGNAVILNYVVDELRAMPGSSSL